jgi:metacaspase-1
MARKALCVGINQFKNYPNNGLNGCVNDVKDMASVLTDFLGFTSGDIITLTDSQATKANILSNLTAMVQDAKANKFDYLVFSLSSHGTQTPDTSGDESDKYDEAFCPHDLAVAGDHWDPQHILLDDELHDLFVQLPKTVLLEVYLDTCHSGTGLKAIDFLFDRKPRYLPPPSLKSFDMVDESAPRGFYKSFGKKATQQQILWAGCRADQTSADAHISGTWHGAFTYFFCKELRASQNKLTRAELLKKVRADLKVARYTQTPQLECQATTRRTKIA